MYAVNGPDGGDGAVQGFVVNPRAKSKREVVAGTFGESELTEPHDLLVTNDANEVFVAETNPDRLWKFVRGKNSRSPLCDSTSVRLRANSPHSSRLQYQFCQTF